MRVKCLAQEHNEVPCLGLEPRLFDLEYGMLTIRPLDLPHITTYLREISSPVFSNTSFLDILTLNPFLRSLKW